MNEALKQRRPVFGCVLFEDEPERYSTRRCNDTCTCSNESTHTLSPQSYSAWHAWAAKMHRTGHRQFRCSTCQHWAVWS